MFLQWCLLRHRRRLLLALFVPSPPPTLGRYPFVCHRNRCPCSSAKNPERRDTADVTTKWKRRCSSEVYARWTRPRQRRGWTRPRQGEGVKNNHVISTAPLSRNVWAYWYPFCLTGIDVPAHRIRTAKNKSDEVDGRHIGGGNHCDAINIYATTDYIAVESRGRCSSF